MQLRRLAWLGKWGGKGGGCQAATESWKCIQIDGFAWFGSMVLDVGRMGAGGTRFTKKPWNSSDLQSLECEWAVESLATSTALETCAYETLYDCKINASPLKSLQTEEVPSGSTCRTLEVWWGGERHQNHKNIDGILRSRMVWENAQSDTKFDLK